MDTNEQKTIQKIIHKIDHELKKRKEIDASKLASIAYKAVMEVINESEG